MLNLYDMNIFPSIPDVILAIFAALLSLAASLFLVKIQNATGKSVKKLEEDQKILIAKESEVRNLIQSKIVTTQEAKDAKDFLDNEMAAIVDEYFKKMLNLRTQAKKIAPVFIFGVVMMVLSLGTSFHMWFAVIANGGKIYLSEFLVFALVNIISLIYVWFEGRMFKKYMKEFDDFKKQFIHSASEILRALELSNKYFDSN